MALELKFYAHNVSIFGPDLALSGDPGVDIPALTAAGFVAGAIVKLVPSTNNPDGVALALADGAVDLGHIFGVIITQPGEFASSITPSASNKISVAWGRWIGDLYGSGFDTTQTYVFGGSLYCDNGANKGRFTNVSTGNGNPVGICTHVPTTYEPWLGIAWSL
jgi:hypothetical protein